MSATGDLMTSADAGARDGAMGTPPPTAPVAATRATSTMAPADVTATLASLADLRDRGAITPEEYEAKKSELLGPSLARRGRRWAGPA